MRSFPAEWHPQSAILLAMPHAKSDWAPYLPQAQQTFRAIIDAIVQHESCIVLVDDVASFPELSTIPRVKLVEIETNDTWARDFGPISVVDRGHLHLLDFGFNGWGLKFAANHDNLLTRKLHQRGILEGILETRNLILEGGSIESNGAGVLLTNTQCLLEANRNPQHSQEEIERILQEVLGIKQVLWLTHGYLAGDDTDSHIDTLARFVGENKIVYLACEDPMDEHYEALSLMQEELKQLKNLKGEPFELFALPFTKAIYFEGERLPSSYANFLFINGAVLVPIYNDPCDQKALEVMRLACPEHTIIPIDCSVLIRQHGSLHCVTMQIPAPQNA